MSHMRDPPESHPETFRDAMTVMDENHGYDDL